MEDAAFAKLVSIAIKEFYGVPTSEEAAFVEFLKGRNGEREHDDEAGRANGE